MTEQEWLACTDPRRMLAFLRDRTGDRKLRLFGCACARLAWDELAGEKALAAVEVVERLADDVLDRNGFALAIAGLIKPCSFTLGPQRESSDPATTGLFEIKSPTPGTFYAQSRPGAAPYVVVGSRVSPTTIVCMIEALKLFNDIEAECHGIITEALVADAALVEFATPLFRVVPTLPVEATGTEQGKHIQLVHDIFGNPFRPVRMHALWRTPVVRSLALAAYQERSLPDGTMDRDRLAILADALEDAGCDDPELLSHLRGPGPHVRGCWALDLLLNQS